MATIKAFTDLAQSRNLAEILPLESADMHYNNASIRGLDYADEHRAELMDYNTAMKALSKYTINPLFEVIPCWSLTALLGAIAVYGIIDIRFLQSTYDNKGNHLTNVWCLTFEDIGTVTLDLYADNPIDACYEMIIQLNELKML